MHTCVTVLCRCRCCCCCCLCPAAAREECYDHFTFYCAYDLVIHEYMNRMDACIHYIYLHLVCYSHTEPPAAEATNMLRTLHKRHKDDKDSDDDPRDSGGAFFALYTEEASHWLYTIIIIMAPHAWLCGVCLSRKRDQREMNAFALSRAHGTAWWHVFGAF